MRQFYETYKNWNTVCSELSWSHYRLLMRIKEPEKRTYYQQECIECAWSVRQLERQINSFSEKNEAMVKYSVLNESTQLFASKYKLYIPTEEELKRELERERFNIEQKLFNPE